MNGNNNNSSTSQPQEKAVRDTAAAAAAAAADGAAGIEFESDDDFSDDDDDDEGYSFIPTPRRAAASAAVATKSSIGGREVVRFENNDNTSNINSEGDWDDDDDADDDDTNDDDQKVNANANDEISEEFDKFLSDDDDDDDDDSYSNKEGNDKKNGIVEQGTTNSGHDRIVGNNNASTKDLEFFGQRARARYLKEELQKKQKKIQVVDYIPPKLQSQKMAQSDVFSRKKPPPPPPKASQQCHLATAGTESSSTTRTNGKRSDQSHLDYSNPSSKKRRSTFSSLKPTKKNGSDDNGNVTCWMPDISKIIQPLRPKTSTIGEEEKVSQKILQQSHPSSWVVVHGLPHDSTPDDVRRFFLGLKPQIICVLLTNNVCMEYLLDASNLHHYHEQERIENQKGPDFLSPPRQTSNFGQPRQLSISASPSFEELNAVPDITTARVIVKFESSGIAGLAEERSGETLSMASTPSGSNTSSSTPLPPRRYYAIAVTQLDKFAAKHLVRNVAVDIKEIVFRDSPSVANCESDESDDDSRKIKPKIYTFSDYVDIVVRQLPPFVLESLWTCVEQKYINYRLRDAKNKSLRRRDQNFIKLDDNIKNAKVLMKFEDTCWKSRRDEEDGKVTAIDLTSLAGYQSLARHHNRIANIIEDMEEWMDNQNRGGNKSLSYCAVSLRLTEQAITGFLDQQLNRLDDLAFQARVARRIDMNRSKTT